MPEAEQNLDPGARADEVAHEMGPEAASSLAALEHAIGYDFQSPELLLRSLTHSSRTQEATSGEELSNERMEFLGDSVLGFLVSEYLLHRFPEYSEGQLSKLKAHFVSALHLHEAAKRLDMGRYLRLGKGEERSGGRSKKTLLADALEALVAALYLDGGMDPARAFVGEWILSEADTAEIHTEDYKSELQELLQSWHGPQPRYFVIRERGPEHHKVFTVEVRTGGDRLAEAEGISKKAAEQAAARIALEKLREKKFDRET